MPAILAASLLALLACASDPLREDASAHVPPPPEGPAAAPPQDDAPPEQDPDAGRARDEGAAGRVAARHVLVSFVGAKGRPLGVNRSRDEALDRAEEIHARLVAGEDFAAVARAMSDDATARRGGFLGSAGPGGWVPAFEAAARALPLGGLSEVVETEYGFHVIRREALVEARVRHVVVQHAGARDVPKASPAATRTRAEAEAIAARALAALDDGEPFEEVARRFSDGPMGPRGGDLGWVVKGDLGPAFDEAVFALAPGERSGIIESPFGLHVIERVE